MMHTTKPITTAEAAKILDCVPENVRKLAKMGHLRVAAVVGRGQRLFDEEDVRQLAEARRLKRRPQ